MVHDAETRDEEEGREARANANGEKKGGAAETRGREVHASMVHKLAESFTAVSTCSAFLKIHRKHLLLIAASPSRSQLTRPAWRDCSGVREVVTPDSHNTVERMRKEEVSCVKVQMILLRMNREREWIDRPAAKENERISESRRGRNVTKTDHQILKL